MRPFALERWFARHEFSTPLMLSASDCETRSVGELLALAGRDPAALHDLRLGYTESRGAPDLRARIAGLYGDGLGPDQVLVTSAPEEGIYLALRTLLAPDDGVVVQTPCYQSLAEVARDRGARVHEWPVAPSPSGWSLDLDRLSDLLQTAPRLLVVNVPHNPTGLLPGRASWLQLLEMAAAAGVRVFSDEMYRGLEPSDDLRLPSAATILPDAIALWGLSKSFGLPGLRCGWLVSRDADALERAEAYKDYTTICPPAPVEPLAVAALDAADLLLAASRSRIAGNTARAEAFVGRHRERFSWHPPQAGPVALLGLLRDSATALSEQLRREAGVLAAPAGLFGYGDGHLRLGLGRDGFGAALEALERWLDRPA